MEGFIKKVMAIGLLCISTGMVQARYYNEDDDGTVRRRRYLRTKPVEKRYQKSMRRMMREQGQQGENGSQGQQGEDGSQGQQGEDEQ